MTINSSQHSSTTLSRVCLPVFPLHQVDNPARRANEDNLHYRIVQGEVRASQEVDISRHKHQQVQRLRLERDATTRPRFMNLLYQDEDCRASVAAASRSHRASVRADQQQPASLTRRHALDARWAKSPNNLKMFMVLRV